MLHPTLEKVRISSAKAYKELIKSNLTLLLNIETGFNFDALEVISSGHHSDTIFGAPLTQEGICTINQLIDHILKRPNIIQEGIFRIPGNSKRQELLQSSLCKGTTIDLDLAKFKINDICCLLKKFLRDLPQPLLLDGLRSLWMQIGSSSVPSSRRLDAVQLLLLLLPSQNREFFKDLVKMFTSVLTYADRNKMTSTNLATIFTPMLFLPKEVAPEVLARQSTQLASALDFIIRQGAVVFEPPTKLLEDSRTYLENLRKTTTPARQQMLMSTTALIPTTKFCATTETPKDYTQQMLAQLMADINSIPQSSVKKSNHKNKLIKKLQKTPANSLDTPLTKLKRDKEQQALIKESLKKSSSKVGGGGGHHHHHSSGLAAFGSAIKRRLKMTPSGGDKGGGGHTKSPGMRRKSISSSAMPQLNFGLSGNVRRLSREGRTATTNIPIQEELLPEIAVVQGGGGTPKRRSISTGVFISVPKADSPVAVGQAEAEKPEDSPDSSVPSVPVRSLSKALPPLLPPKPSPGTILKRKASIYSLPPLTTSKMLDSTHRRSISARSLPACPATESVLRLRRSKLPSFPSPLAELSNQKKVKALLEKYESLSKASRIPRLSRKPSIPKSSPDTPSSSAEDENENYVCMLSMPMKKKMVTATATSTLLRKSSSKRGSTKSPRSLLPVAEDQIRMSVKKTKIRRPLDLDLLQPRTPM